MSSLCYTIIKEINQDAAAAAESEETMKITAAFEKKALNAIREYREDHPGEYIQRTGFHHYGKDYIIVEDADCFHNNHRIFIFRHCQYDICNTKIAVVVDGKIIPIDLIDPEYTGKGTPEGAE